MNPTDGSGGARDPLATRARATPDRTALVSAAEGTGWRYDELDGAIDAMARHLAGLGLEPGDHLGLLAPTSIDAVGLLHAAWRLGLRLVPLNARGTSVELADRADRSDLDALACTRSTAETAAGIVDSPVVSIDGTVAECLGENAGDGLDGSSETGDAGETGETDVGAAVRALTTIPTARLPRVTTDRDDVALMLFTSGTTGTPKTVQLTMGNLLASATASAFRLGVQPGDRWLLCLPVYHMGGLAPVLRTALYGTTLVVLGGFDPEEVARTTQEHEITGLSLVPTQLRRILNASAAFGRSVRTVLLGGAPAPASLVQRCRDRDVPIYPTYGLTETASQVATATPEQAFAHEGTVGQPLYGVEVTIVDDEANQQPAGERGEVVVSGPTVTPGYYAAPEATRGAFSPLGIHTGDVGYLDEDGRLWVTGRRTDRIVTGGENVDPAEVAAVIREYDGVADVAVVGLPDPDWGERVAALVATQSGQSVDAETLLRHCRERLAGFRVPKTVEFAEALPRTASGTVDRRAVRQRLSGCAP